MEQDKEQIKFKMKTTIFDFLRKMHDTFPLRANNVFSKQQISGLCKEVIIFPDIFNEVISELTRDEILQPTNLERPNQFRITEKATNII